MNLTDFIGKQRLIARMPKELRSELKMVLYRNNFYEVKDVGNEQYIINVVSEDDVIERKNTEGYLTLMCATSRFQMKMLRYEMKFTEDKSELVVLKEKDLMLTDAEEAAWEKYIEHFSNTIKKQLRYQVEFSLREVESVVEKVEPKKEEVVVTQEPAVTLVNNDVVEESQFVSFNPLDEIIKLSKISKSGARAIQLVAYARSGEFGIAIDAQGSTLANMKISDDKLTDDEEVMKMAIATVTLAQSIGTYIKSKGLVDDVDYYFYKDREVHIAIPSRFEVIDEEDLMQANN